MTPAKEPKNPDAVADSLSMAMERKLPARSMSLPFSARLPPARSGPPRAAQKMLAPPLPLHGQGAMSSLLRVAWMMVADELALPRLTMDSNVQDEQQQSFGITHPTTAVRFKLV